VTISDDEVARLFSAPNAAPSCSGRESSSSSPRGQGYRTDELIHHPRRRLTRASTREPLTGFLRSPGGVAVVPSASQ
jgi:hypothetical protein